MDPRGRADLQKLAVPRTRYFELDSMTEHLKDSKLQTEGRIDHLCPSVLEADPTQLAFRTFVTPNSARIITEAIASTQESRIYSTTDQQTAINARLNLTCQ